MFRFLARGLGRMAILAATAALLTGVSLLVGGAFLMTWPLLRKSPREQRLQAATEMAAAGLVLLGTLKKGKHDDVADMD
jgi:cytochrome c oxidase assembly factor CtaG